jgi:hypothetical protein
VLLDIRFFVGRFFGWDHEPAATAWKTFATRLTDTDHSRSLAAAETRDGFFRVVYRFENEQLVELINRTAHAAALSALVETATAYRFYLGVYVRSVSRFTPFYMALIDPFRKTDRLSVPLARCPCELESSIRHRLTRRYCRASGASGHVARPGRSILTYFLGRDAPFRATLQPRIRQHEHS